MKEFCEFKIQPWDETVQKIRKLAADCFYEDVVGKIKKKRSKLMMVIDLPEDRVDLKLLANRLIQLDRVVVVFRYQGNIYQDTCTVLASKHKNWKVGHCSFQSFG